MPQSALTLLNSVCSSEEPPAWGQGVPSQPKDKYSDKLILKSGRSCTGIYVKEDTQRPNEGLPLQQASSPWGRSTARATSRLCTSITSATGKACMHQQKLLGTSCAPPRAHFQGATGACIAQPDPALTA